MTAQEVANFIRANHTEEDIIKKLEELTLKEKLEVLDYFSNYEKSYVKKFADAFYKISIVGNTPITQADLGGKHLNYLVILQNLMEAEQGKTQKQDPRQELLLATLNLENLCTFLYQLEIQKKTDILLFDKICKVGLNAAILKYGNNKSSIQHIRTISSFLDSKYHYKKLSAIRDTATGLINWIKPDILPKRNDGDTEFNTDQARVVMHMGIADYLSENKNSNAVINYYLKTHHLQFFRYLAEEHKSINDFYFDAESTDQTDIGAVLCSDVIKKIVETDTSCKSYISSILKKRQPYNILQSEFYQEYVIDIASKDQSEDKHKLDNMFYSYILANDPQLTQKAIDYIVNQTNLITKSVHRHHNHHFFLRKFLQVAIKEDTAPEIRANILAQIATSAEAEKDLQLVNTLDIFNDVDITNALQIIPSLYKHHCLELFSNIFKKTEPATPSSAPQTQPVVVITTPLPTQTPEAPATPSNYIPQSPAKPRPMSANFDAEPIASMVMKIIAKRFFKTPSPLDETFKDLLKDAISKKGAELGYISDFAGKFVEELKTDHSIFTERKHRKWPQFFIDLALTIYYAIFHPFEENKTGNLWGEGIITFSEDFKIEKLSAVIDKVMAKNNVASTGMSIS